MIELDDITLKEYFELEDKEAYDFAIKYSKELYNSPIDIFNAGDFTEMEFGLIKDLQYDFENGLTWMKLLEYISQISGKDIKQIVQFRLLSICRFRNYLTDEIKRINEIEIKLLGHDPSPEEVQAGISEFNKFGSYGQIRKLAMDDVTKIKEVKKIKYSTCLMELYYQKTANEFQEAYYNIKYPKPNSQR